MTHSHLNSIHTNNSKNSGKLLNLFYWTLFFCFIVVYFWLDHCNAYEKAIVTQMTERKNLFFLNTFAVSINVRNQFWFHRLFIDEILPFGFDIQSTLVKNSNLSKITILCHLFGQMQMYFCFSICLHSFSVQFQLHWYQQITTKKKRLISMLIKC